jgi:hypothetical protein
MRPSSIRSTIKSMRSLRETRRWLGYLGCYRKRNGRLKVHVHVTIISPLAAACSRITHRLLSMLHVIRIRSYARWNLLACTITSPISSSTIKISSIIIPKTPRSYVLLIVSPSGRSSVYNYFPPFAPFERANSRMVQRQQQIVGEPSEREALLTILLNIPAR